MKKKAIVLALLCLGLAGCATVRQAVQDTSNALLTIVDAAQSVQTNLVGAVQGSK